MRRRFIWSIFLVLALGAICACDGENQAYTDACTAETPEAFAQYLVDYPEGLHAADVRHRLDLAEFDIAEKANTAASFEKYLADHPDGKYVDRALDEAKNLAWDDAEKANTVDAMVAFKEKYGTGAFGIKTDARLEALRFAVTSVQFNEFEVERVNVAGERRGELNGYAIRAKVSNGGEQACKVMKVRVVFQGEDSAIVDTKFEFVATPSHPMGIPIPERLKLPFQPGQEREFEYLIGDPNVPKGWVPDADHTRIEVTEIDFVEG